MQAQEQQSRRPLSRCRNRTKPAAISRACWGGAAKASPDPRAGVHLLFARTRARCHSLVLVAFVHSGAGRQSNAIVRTGVGEGSLSPKNGSCGGISKVTMLTAADRGEPVRAAGDGRGRHGAVVAR